MEEKAFFTAKEREQLFALYKRLLQLSGDTLQKGDCHRIRFSSQGNYDVKCMAPAGAPIC